MGRSLGEARYIPGGAVGRAGGRATKVDGGYRISGRWPFASGAPHATHLSGRSLVYDTAGEPLIDPALGVQAQIIAVFPQSDVTIHDTWDGLGLRGTQSVDYEVQD